LLIRIDRSDAPAYGEVVTEANSFLIVILDGMAERSAVDGGIIWRLRLVGFYIWRNYV
jgi:hypothetical protein